MAGPCGLLRQKMTVVMYGFWGNQSNRVSIEKYAGSKLLGYRRYKINEYEKVIAESLELGKGPL